MGHPHFCLFQSAQTPSSPEASRRFLSQTPFVSAGNYLILDGYGTVQESSTDEEVSALVLQCTSHGRPSLDSAQQQQQQPLSPRDTQSDGGSSPFPEELLGSRWAGLEEPCPFLGSPQLPLDTRVQLVQYIQNIEDALEKLKVRCLLLVFSIIIIIIFIIYYCCCTWNV